MRVCQAVEESQRTRGALVLQRNQTQSMMYDDPSSSVLASLQACRSWDQKRLAGVIIEGLTAERGSIKCGVWVPNRKGRFGN